MQQDPVSGVCSWWGWQCVTKVTSPLFFLYFSDHFSCLKHLLCYHMMPHMIPPSLSTTHYTFTTQPYGCQPLTQPCHYLYDITQLAAARAPVKRARCTLELLSFCTVMTSCLTHSLSTLNVSYLHYSAHDITCSHDLAFATLFYSCATFHSMTSCASAQFCHPSY